MSEPMPPKVSVARILLERGSVFVHLNPQAEDVVVPDYLRKRPGTVLEIGLNLPKPIPDLVVDDAGIRGTLSFDCGFVPCYVPWSAVYALVGPDDRGIVWEDSVPPEVAAERKRDERPKLRLVR